MTVLERETFREMERQSERRGLSLGQQDWERVCAFKENSPVKKYLN